MRVPGFLTIRGAGIDRSRLEPVDVTLGVRRSGEGTELSIRIDETGTEWTVDLDAAAGAYIAGSLASASGVTIETIGGLRSQPTSALSYKGVDER